MNEETPEKKAEARASLLSYINSTPDLLSLLYDLDLMPEQLKERTFEWHQMLTLAAWHHYHFQTPQVPSEATPRSQPGAISSETCQVPSAIVSDASCSSVASSSSPETPSCVGDTHLG